MKMINVLREKPNAGNKHTLFYLFSLLFIIILSFSFFVEHYYLICNEQKVHVKDSVTK